MARAGREFKPRVAESGIATFYGNLYLFRMPLKAIDFFCGAGGMSYGLARSGVKILAGIDCDPACKATYEHNNKPARFLERDIATLNPVELAAELGVEQNDNDLILIGCSPCQFWSKINTDKTKSQKSAFLLREFERFVDWFNPDFVVIENVPGLLTKKKQTILQTEQSVWFISRAIRTQDLLIRQIARELLRAQQWRNLNKCFFLWSIVSA
jgi:hypothetical protein